MGYEVLSIAFLFVLQCDLYQGTSVSNQNVVYELAIPSFAVNNRQPNQNRMPYPYYRPFNNGCNICQQSRICNRRCSNNNNQFDVRLPENPVSLSVPSVNGQRINVIFGKPGSQNFNRGNNGKQRIKIIVKLIPKNTTKSNNKPSSVTTTANSTAVNNKDGQQIKAKTTAENPDVKVEVEVVDTNTGDTPKNTEFESEIIATDSEGNIAESKTNATIKKENKGDKDAAKEPPPSNDKKDDKAPPPPNDKKDDKGTDKKPPPSNDKKDNEAPPPPSDKKDAKDTDKKPPPSDDKKDDKAPPPPKDKNDDKDADKAKPAPNDTVEEPAAPVDEPTDKADKPPNNPADKPADKPADDPAKKPEDEKDKPDDKTATAATDAGSNAAADDGKVASASDTSGAATSGP